jgi:hypothetical protein
VEQIILESVFKFGEVQASRTQAGIINPAHSGPGYRQN